MPQVYAPCRSVRTCLRSAEVLAACRSMTSAQGYGLERGLVTNLTSQSPFSHKNRCCEQKYINVVGGETASPHEDGGLFHQTGRGWLQRNETYQTYFAGTPVYNAVYTHQYDEQGDRLFVAGGPLQLGLCGGYAAVWQ